MPLRDGVARWMRTRTLECSPSICELVSATLRMVPVTRFASARARWGDPGKSQTGRHPIRRCPRRGVWNGECESAAGLHRGTADSRQFEAPRRLHNLRQLRDAPSGPSTGILSSNLLTMIWTSPPVIRRGISPAISTAITRVALSSRWTTVLPGLFPRTLSRWSLTGWARPAPARSSESFKHPSGSRHSECCAASQDFLLYQGPDHDFCGLMQSLCEL